MGRIHEAAPAWSTKSANPLAVIPGLEGYAVSDCGEVVSLNYRGRGRPCLLRPLVKRRYHHVALGSNGKHVHFRVHRLVATAFIGTPPTPSHVVNHKNGNPSDNRVENLEWVTVRENCLHAYRTGLHTISKRHRHQAAKQCMKRRKLTMNDAANVRWLFASGRFSKRKIAEMYRIDLKCIRWIIDGRSYLENAQ